MLMMIIIIPTAVSLDLPGIPQSAPDSNLLSELQESQKIKLSHTEKSVRDQRYQLWVSCVLRYK